MNRKRVVMRKVTRLERPRRVSFTEICRQLDEHYQRVNYLLNELGHAFGADKLRTNARYRGGITYDASIIDYLAEVLDKPHRSIDEPETDWLAQHLRSERHGSPEPTRTQAEPPSAAQQRRDRGR